MAPHAQLVLDTAVYATRVFVAVNGVSVEARDAITRGKQPSFFVIDGYDLMMVLSEAMSLTDSLRRRIRLFLEEGRVCVPFSDLM